MTVYGITRASTRKQQASPEVQAEMIRKHCAAVQLPEPTILDEPLGTSGRSTDFRHRPQGRWLLLHAQPGDVLVVTKLDRLGRTARDILDTLEQFAKRNVRVIVIQFLGGQNIDMDSTVGSPTHEQHRPGHQSNNRTLHPSALLSAWHDPARHLPSTHL